MVAPMPTELKPVQSPCPSCRKSTWHDIKCVHTENGAEDYHFAAHYMVVQCRGCKNTSFRDVFRDYEIAFPTPDGDWDVPQTVKTYPKFIKDHNTLNGSHHVPSIVREIYEESLKAIQEDAAILAGLGLRGTIEAISNDREITGRNLEMRISRLATQGFISQKDAERLQAIRFLGNDAAHDIKKPTKNQIEIALRIIEHLITTVYILDAEARGKLDTIVSDYDDFKQILNKQLKNFSPGDEYPLAKFLDKDVRRIQGALSQLEARLVIDISTGDYMKLSVGKIDFYGSLPTKLQHFTVIKQ